MRQRVEDRGNMHQRPPLPSEAYTSRFDEWDKKAWVRAKPHRLAPFEPGLQFYSESLAVLFHVAEVAKADSGVRRKLLALHLFSFLEFTVWLELGPVNEVCELIRRPDFLPWLPSQMKDDALKIYVDEAGHAEMSAALERAVSKSTGLQPLRTRPRFLSMLDSLVEAHEPELAPLIKLMFVVISETLITGTLTTLPKDPTVQRAVKELAADHATDEGRHHAYFRDLFSYVWPRFPGDLRQILGPVLPKMILAFLEPDPNNLRRMLEVFPQEFPLPEGVVAAAIAAPSTASGMRYSAKPTLRMLADAGVLAEPTIHLAFVRSGLLLADA
jgi:hypothetical protein